MYTFLFAQKAINVSGTGRFVATFAGILELESLLPVKTGEKVLSFASAASNTAADAQFYAHIDDINHGLGPSATVEDVIDWIFANTSTLTMPVPASSVSFDPTGTDLTATTVQGGMVELADRDVLLGHSMHGTAQPSFDPFNPNDDLHTNAAKQFTTALSGFIYGFTFRVPKKVTIDSARIYVQTGVVGSTLNLTVYEASTVAGNLVAGAKVADLMVAQSTGSAGEKIATGLDVTLDPHLLYVMGIRLSSGAVYLVTYIANNNLRSVFRDVAVNTYARLDGTNATPMPASFPATPVNNTVTTWVPAIELGISTQ